MAKYKVYFEGYTVVEADSVEEALDNVDEGCYIYEEREYTDVKECFE